MSYNVLDIGQPLSGLFRVFAHVSDKVGAQSRDQVLHLFTPIGLDGSRIENWGHQIVVVSLHLWRKGDEGGVQLEGISHVVGETLRYDSIQSWG